MNKKISVVLPVYNGEERVSKAIESILFQTYDNIELILVNDCSSDGTRDVLNEFANRDARIKIINNATNQKLPKSLNIGFKTATGDYLTWTSDDNTYKPLALSKMAGYLDRNPDIDFVYADFDVVNLDGTYRSTTLALAPDEMRFQNPVGACFLYRKELAEKIGEYDPELFLAEDYEYWIRAYLAGKLHHMNENLYNYGWHDGSLTVTREKQVYHKTFEAKDKHFAELLARCDTQEERNKFFYGMLRLLLDENEKEIARKDYYGLDSAFKQFDKKAIKVQKREKSFFIRCLRHIRRC